jgi:hypothetical protein
MNAPWTLPQKPGSAVFDEGARSLKTLPKGSVQGAHLGARSLNAPLGSTIRERVRGGGGALPRSLGWAHISRLLGGWLKDKRRG